MNTTETGKRAIVRFAGPFDTLIHNFKAVWGLNNPTSDAAIDADHTRQDQEQAAKDEMGRAFEPDPRD